MDLQHVYDGNFQFTGVRDFGIPLEDILSGATPPPPSGARVDVDFAGAISGPGLSGELVGVDYLNIRADGRVELNLRGTITTGDGARIAFLGEGTMLARDDGLPLIRERIQLTTHAEPHAWVNGLTFLGRGTVDPGAGRIAIGVYR